MGSEIIVVLVLIFIVPMAYAGLSAAPWVPTRGADMERFLKLARIQSGQKMYDIGCGDGRILCVAARAGACAEGLEVSFLPYLVAYARVLLQGRRRAKVRLKSFWKKNLGDADIVYFFLTPKPLPRLKVKLEKELKKGTKVISYAFPVEGWVPIVIDTEKNQTSLYLYEIGKQ